MSASLTAVPPVSLSSSQPSSTKRSYGAAFTTLPPNTATTNDVAVANLTSSPTNGVEPAAKKRKLEPLSINGTIPKKPLSEEERTGKVSMIAKMQKIVTNADSDSEKLHSEQMVYKYAFEVEQSDNQTLRSEVDALNEQITKLKQKTAGLTDQLKTKQYAVEAGNTLVQMEALKKQVQEQKIEDYKKLQAEHTKVKKEIDLLNAQVKRLTKDLTDKTDIINAFSDTEKRKVPQEDLQKLREQITSLETHNRSMDKQLTQIKRENSELTEDRNSAQVLLKEEIRLKTAANEKSRVYQKKAEELKSTHQKLEAALQEGINAKAADIEKLNKTHQKKIDELTAKHQQHLEESEALYKKQIEEVEAFNKKKLEDIMSLIAQQIHGFADTIKEVNKT